MFNNKVLISISLILLATFVGSKYNEYMNDNNDYDMIKMYLLNDSPLYGSNKPKLWIHTKYDINARTWLDFHSRNSNHLNQPYIELTIGSVINFCSNDFHICLIDDKSFSKLIPGWDVDIYEMSEPMKSYMRNIALLKLLNIYGGMMVPDTFLCTKNLKQLYYDGIDGKLPFVCEKVNRTANMQNKPRLTLVPDTYFMGSTKRNPVLDLLIEKYELLVKQSDFTDMMKFNGAMNDFLVAQIEQGKVNLVEGEKIGIRNKDGVLLIENLVSESPLRFSKQCYGIYIPGDEFLKRTKYQWFSVMPLEELVNSKMAIASYFNISMIDASIQKQYNMATLL
jgi:hypothetical protein